MIKQFLALFLLVGSVAHAQTYEQDILKFSFNDFNGTSRFVALGGAFSSVGADFSNLSYNPAGVGMYRSSVVVASLSVPFSHTTSSYLGTSTKETDVSFAFGSAGIIFSTGDMKKSKAGLFKNAALGLGVNRMADFNSREVFNGFNADNSLTHIWVNEAQAGNGSNNLDVDFDRFSFETVNAYQTFLVNFDSTILGYTSPIEDSVAQKRIFESTGGKSEMVLSAGANFMDKLYFGATVGVPFVNYESTSIYTESDTADVNGDFRDFTLDQNYNTSGVGFNFKVGMIYKPHEIIRISGAIQTPERISLTEFYNSRIKTNFDTINYDVESPEGTFDYIARLPWRANLGTSLFYKKHGFISFDYEYVAYSSMKYRFDSEFAVEEQRTNDNIKNTYQGAHNFRVGAEGVIKKVLRLRAGYHYQGNPFQEQIEYDASAHNISGGLGLVIKRFAIDAAYRYTITQATEQLYTGTSPIQKDIADQMVSVTFGYKLK